MSSVFWLLRLSTVATWCSSFTGNPAGVVDVCCRSPVVIESGVITFSTLFDYTDLNGILLSSNC